MLQSALRWLGREVYGSFVPLEGNGSLRGAEDYLSELWRTFPKRIALSHTLLCVAVMVLPCLTKSLRPLFLLNRSAKNHFASHLLRSRLYLFRLIAYGVKGHALVATLRTAAARDSLVESSSPAERQVG